MSTKIFMNLCMVTHSAFVNYKPSALKLILTQMSKKTHCFLSLSMRTFYFLWYTFKKMLAQFSYRGDLIYFKGISFYCTFEAQKQYCSIYSIALSLSFFNCILSKSLCLCKKTFNIDISSDLYIREQFCASQATAGHRGKNELYDYLD